jgi:hypothetical protein
MSNHLVLVAGSSRSGTSLFTGMLQAIGAHVPQPEVAPDDSNPRGFSEPRWVVDFHSALLRAASVHVGDARPSAWAATADLARDRQPRRQLERWLAREFRHADLVVVKDPRLLWFTGLWDRAAGSIAPVRYATVLRHPVEVVKSQQTYYVQWDDNSRTAGWLNTMLFTERATRSHVRGFVRYDDLVADPMAALSEVCTSLELALLDQVTLPQMQAVNRLVDPSLRRSSATWDSMTVDRRLVDLAEEAWRLLSELGRASGDQAAKVNGELDQLRRDYVELYAFAESVSQFSLYAAQRSTNLTTRIANRWAPNQPPLTPRMAADKLIRRVARRVRRAAHQIDRTNRPGERPGGEDGG